MLYRVKKIAYIRQGEGNYLKKRERILMFVRNLFCIVKFENIENGLIISLPTLKLNSKYIQKRIVYKIKKIIDKCEIENIVFENNLKKLSQYFNNMTILDGKYFMKNSVLKILEYIHNINVSNINLENIYVFVNEYNCNNLHIIEHLISNFKTVNIITENLKKYRRLEEGLYRKGILITVSSNKRKSARNARYIINVDFSEESFKSYSINRNSIIINLTNQATIVEKSFNGILINNFEIDICKDSQNFVNEFYGDLSRKEYLESFLINNENDYYMCDELYKKYKCEIKALFGIRGIIQQQEFKNI